MTRLDAVRDFQKAMKGRVFVTKLSSKYWMYDDGDRRRWTPWEQKQAANRASGLPEEFEH